MSKARDAQCESLAARAKCAYEAGENRTDPASRQRDYEIAVQYWSKAVEVSRDASTKKALCKNLVLVHLQLAILLPSESGAAGTEPAFHMGQIQHFIEVALRDQELVDTFEARFLGSLATCDDDHVVRLLRQYLGWTPSSPQVSLELALRLVRRAQSGLVGADFDEALCQAGSRSVNGGVHVKRVEGNMLFLDCDYHGLRTGERVTYFVDSKQAAQLTVPLLFGAMSTYLRNGQAMYVRSMGLTSVELYDSEASAVAGKKAGLYVLVDAPTGNYGVLGSSVPIQRCTHSSSAQRLTFTTAGRQEHALVVGTLVTLRGVTAADPSRAADLARGSGHRVVDVAQGRFSIAFPCPATLSDEAHASTLLGMENLGLQRWIAARQPLFEACTHLEKATECAGGPARADGEDWGSVAEQAKYLLHRSAAVLSLWGALREQHLLMNSSEFDMPWCYEVMDMLKRAARVAESGDGLPGSLGCPSADVEVGACCRHYLARLYNVMGMAAKARDEHRACVQMVLSLDVAQQTGGCQEAQEGSIRATLSNSRTGAQFQHVWYKESAQYILMCQQRDLTEEEETLKVRQERIQPVLAKLNAANTGKVALLVYLRDTYPDPTLEDIEPAAGMEKKDFMKFILAFHPDRLETRKEVPPPQKGWIASDWNTLFTEIGKRLNHWYEADYK